MLLCEKSERESGFLFGPFHVFILSHFSDHLQTYLTSFAGLVEHCLAIEDRV